MCGICGIFDLDKNKQDVLDVESMMKHMKHRGPDDEGILADSNLVLGFVRLSIIDLSKSGNQPFIDASGRYSIVFNGEIYNYIELRKILVQKGYNFRTKTDTEVLLYSFIEWNLDCLDKFNGMFAFAIYDNQEKVLFIARDRYGIKPFYYTLEKNKFIFCSEILPMVKTFSNLRNVNDASVFNYLLYNRTDYDNSTFFKDIYRLPHGCYGILKESIQIKPWYNLIDNLGKGFESGEEYHELLKSSVELRLRSDVPVGVCLSGGLDSSSIASVLIKDFGNREINTFSAVYSDDYIHNEEKYIKLFEKDLKNMNYITPCAESLLSDIYEYIEAQEEPVPTTNPYAQYKVMQLAKNKVKVTLDGQGADEQLAGYHYFFGFYYKELLSEMKFLLFIKELYFYLMMHKSVYGVKSLLFLLLPSNIKTSIRKLEKSYISEEFYRNYRDDVTIPENLYSATTLQQSLIDHFQMKLEHLLKWEDRNSMHFSIEARLPFMDYRIIHKTLSTPSEYIIKNGRTKHILRNSLINHLPRDIANRMDKVGFATPSDNWFRENKFREFISDTINSNSFRGRPYFNHVNIEKLTRKHMIGRKNLSKDIWKWINLELWLKSFVDNK